MLDLTDVDLEVGDSTREVACPHCGGGMTGEKSFVVTRTEEGFLYVCHRASCGYRGATYMSRGERAACLARRDGSPKENKPALHKFKGEVTQSDELNEYMLRRFGVSCDLLSDTGRAMFPVRTPHHLQVGWVARAYPEFYKGDMKGARKALEYQEEHYPLGIHFPDKVNWFPTERLVIVEDWVSAEKLAGIGVHAAALLGTDLSLEIARELRAHLGVKELTVCLDFDALGKAVSLKRELSLVFDVITITVLKEDPKDTPVEELRNAFL